MLFISGLIPINAFASQSTDLKDYQDALYEIAEKYHMENAVRFEMNRIPDNTSLSQFERDMDMKMQILSQNLVKVPEDAIVLKDASVNNSPFDGISAFAIGDENYSETKTSSLYFKIWCSYDIGVKDGRRQVVGVRSILGNTTLAGVLMAFTFEQKSTWYRFLSDGTVEAFAVGDWIDNKQGVRVIYLSGYAINGRFGADHL